MNQDVSETCILPINVQRLGVANFLCIWVIGQNAEVLEKNFLDFLVLWAVSEDQRYFLSASGPLPSSGIAELRWLLRVFTKALAIKARVRKGNLVNLS